MKKFIFFLIGILFNVLQVFAQPVINNFAPGSGPIGTIVTIKGTGFSTTSTNNIVFMGAVKANVSTATDTTLIIIVPAGATYMPVSVTTNNLTAYSINPFIVTFAGGGGPFISTSFMPKSDIKTGMYPHSDILADLDGDGKPDLFVSKGSSNTAGVFRNTSSGGNISFATELDLAATGNNHEGTALGDLDGDGKPDIVLTNSNGTNSVSVFRNTSTVGSISFSAKMDFPVVNGPYSVAVGDLDGDGKPDLVIANNGANQISVYRNTSTPGNISFDARIDFTVGTNPYSIAIADLDGDGKADLAITTQGSSSALSVMKNTSTAGVLSFDQPINYATLAGSFVVSVGDLDGDGKPDLAAASSSSNSVTVIRNTSTPGNLSFGSQQNFATGNYPVCVSISDLDGDGRPDMVTSNRFTNNVSALRNISTVGAISFEIHVDYDVDTDPFYVAIGDLDGDGRPDIVAANSASTAVCVLRNIINANLAAVVNSFTPTSGISGTVVKIKGSNFTGATGVTFGGTPASSFTVDSSTGITAIVGAGASGGLAITTSYGTSTLAGFSFNGPIITSFTPTVGVTGTIITITGSNFIHVIDVKFGGIPASSFTIGSSTSVTATVGTGSSGSVTITTDSGTATQQGFSYGAPSITTFTPTSGPAGSVITISGMNFDPSLSGNIVFFGAVKAVISSATPVQLDVIVPTGATYQPISVTTNNLTAFSTLPFTVTFPSSNRAISASSFSVVGNYGTGVYPSAISIGDLDGDGKSDLIVVNSIGNSISILQNLSRVGAVSFNTKIDLSTGPDPKRVAIGDLDGDGKPDIVVVNFNAGNASSISIFKNTSTNGIISFAPKADYSTGNGSIGICIADMNGDGKPDLIVTSGNSGIFSIFQNITLSTGTISFAAKQDYLLLSHPDNIATADLDNDGKPDLITSNFSGNSISIFRNMSTGGNLSLGPEIDYAVGVNPTYVTTGDLDGDGKLDLAVANYTSGTISFFKNYSNTGSVLLGGRQDYPLATSTISFGDLNGDGKIDLCAGRGLLGDISLLENIYSGNGAFSFAPNVDFTTGNFDTYASIGDLDGDGKPDLAVVNTVLNTVTILINKIGAPEIASMSSTTGVMGTLIKLTGNNFTGATSVSFGGTSADSFRVISSTEIDAVVGAGASGDITVTSPFGTGRIGSFNFIPEINAGGPSAFCKDGSVIFSSTAAANNQWYKDGIAINGDTSNTYQANAGGTYTVKVTANGITTSSISGISVTVLTVPSPGITRNENNGLVSSDTTGNQWYFNGNIITGATDQTYQPSQSGSYTVRNTLNGCMSDFSIPYNFELTGMINLGNGQYINLYPNPVGEALNLSWNINGMRLLNIEIMDAQGRQLQTNQSLQNGTVIDLSGLAKGIYFIRIYSYNQYKINKTVRILKVN